MQRVKLRSRKRKARKLTKSEQMARVRSKDTTPEVLLRKALWAQGHRYRLRIKLPGTPDLGFSRARLAIFVDGCFWHGCPEHYCAPVQNAEFWAAKVARNVARDRRVDESLAQLGWRVIRVWEHELAQDLPGVVAHIESLLSTDVE